MKTSIALALYLAGVTFCWAAEGSATNSAIAATAAKLPYGAEDVAKLARSRVSDEIILTYVKNSGTTYQLKPEDIANLKNQGVSDQVVATMIEQGRKTEIAVTPVPVATQVQESPVEAPMAQPAPAPAVPVYVSPQVDEPAPSSGSTLYIIPYPTKTRPFYPSYRVGPSFGYSSYYVIPSRRFSPAPRHAYSYHRR